MIFEYPARCALKETPYASASTTMLIMTKNAENIIFTPFLYDLWFSLAPKKPFVNSKIRFFIKKRRIWGLCYNNFLIKGSFYFIIEIIMLGEVQLWQRRIRKII